MALETPDFVQWYFAMWRFVHSMISHSGNPPALVVVTCGRFHPSAGLVETLQNAFPGTDNKVIPLQLLQSLSDPFLGDRVIDCWNNLDEKIVTVSSLSKLKIVQIMLIWIGT